MRRCREAEASGSLAAQGSLPEELKPFLEMLAEMLAEALLRDPEQCQPIRNADAPSLNHYSVGLESAQEGLTRKSEEA
ncbi:MAG: hypothetical protein ACM36A_11385 [Bacteroidota bacterium]